MSQEWAAWDGKALKPIWVADPTASGSVVRTELYDHKGDDGATDGMWNKWENENLAAANPAVVKALSDRIRAFYAKMAAAR